MKNIFKVKDNLNLTDPDMMQKSIVEFMKYRGSVEIGENLISMIRRNEITGDLIDILTNTDKYKALKDAKEDFYDLESEFAKKSYYTYVELVNYTNKSREYDLDEYTSFENIRKK